MSILCPECMGPLVTQDGVNATCTLHGGQFRILFARNGAPSPMIQQPMAMPAAMPVGAAISPQTTSPQPPTIEEIPLAAAIETSAPRPPTVMCRVHPEMPAVAYCRTCGAPSCNTCDFVFPGNLHLCTSCATKPVEALNPKRKKLLAWSYAMAIWTSIAVVLLMSGVFAARHKADQEAIGIAVEIFVFLPSILGTALGWAALDKRLGNPGWVWGAAIWNSLILGILLILTVVGLTMRA